MTEEFYYVWVSLINDLDYNTFIKLISPLNFKINKLYDVSISRKEFYIYIVKNKIIINKGVYNLLTDNKLKCKANKLYKYIKSKDIFIVHPFTSLYKCLFRNNFNQNPVVFLYGNISLLKKKKYLVYSEKNSKEILEIQNMIIKQISIKNNVLLNVNTKNTLLSDQIIVEDLSNILKQNFIKNNLYIFITGNLYYNISCMCDEFVLINSKYKKEIALIVDSLLEQGKEISILPNNILDKNAYFSNYLLSCGARAIYEISDI